MTANSSTSADVITPLSEEEQAAALWTYVHLRIPRFTSQAALEIVKRLASGMDEAPKALAKRLRKELAAQGIAIKHTAALHAAARLLGHESWYAANQPAPKLRLTTFGERGGKQLVADWQELAPQLCAACDMWLSERTSRLFQVRVGPAYMMMSAAVPKAGESDEQVDSYPLLIVNPVGNEAEWLEEAPGALERLRRYLEESGRAVLDGVAVLELCNAYKNRPNFMWPYAASTSDACNSELILVRADHEQDVGFEIARGDEMTCWYQLELAIKDHKTDEVIIDEEDGAWHVGAGRYVWQLSTLRPKEIVPGLMTLEFGPDYSRTLFRRYKLAKRIFGNRLTHHEQTKRLEYLGTLAEHYRVDLHKLLLAMNKVGLTWESYCAEIGESVPMVSHLQIGFVFTLLERLKFEDPNVVFARPTRSELARVDDDKLLRALMPRVDHVRYRLHPGLSTEIKEAVEEAVEEFSTSIRIQKLQAGGKFIDPKNPLPYLVYASDGEELRLKLDEHGLVMYAGVMPYLLSTKGIIEHSPNMWPFAPGNSLFLDIDLAEEPESRKSEGAS